MNSLERAKRFLAQKASRLALAVVPLAAVAISTPSANATPVVHLNAGNCNVTSGSGSCGTALEGTGGNGQMNWVSVFSSGDILSQSGISGGDVLDLSAAGATNSGAFTTTPTNIPVAWDFLLIDPTDPTVDWTLTFTLKNGTGTGATLYTFQTTGSGSTSSGGTVVSGSNHIHIPASGGTDITRWSVTLTTSASAPYEIDIPGGASFDMNPNGGATTPEPSTLLLMVPGVGALLLLRRKKRS